MCRSRRIMLAPLALTGLMLFALGCHSSDQGAAGEAPAEVATNAESKDAFGARANAEPIVSEREQSMEPDPASADAKDQMTADAAVDPAKPQDENQDLVPNAPKLPLKYATWEDILASVKAAGKPSLVDVWSLACEPCMKEFPGLVMLQNKYGEQLNCVSVNVNFDGRRSYPPESYSGDVVRFLSFNDAQLSNYICTTANDLVFEALEIPSIPAVLLFDAEGNEVARFVDVGETRGFTYESHINSAVAELLGDADSSTKADPSGN